MKHTPWGRICALNADTLERLFVGTGWRLWGYCSVPLVCLPGANAVTLMALSLVRLAVPQGPPAPSDLLCWLCLVLCLSIKVYNQLVESHEALGIWPYTPENTLSSCHI